MKLASLYFLTTPLIVLVGTAIAMALPGERAAMAEHRPHGLSEVLYAFTSAANNNGSRVRRALGATPTGTTPLWAWRCCSAASCRWCSCSRWPVRWRGRARRRESSGTLPTHRPQFVGLVVGVTVILVALTFLPALALGPLAEGITE